MSAQERLASLLGFYLASAYRAAGLTWDSDNLAEVEEMAGIIADIADEQAYEQIKRNAPEGSIQ